MQYVRRNTLATCRSPHETSPFYVNVLVHVNVNVHEKPATPGIIAECIRYLTKKTTGKIMSLILIRVRLRARARAGARFLANS
jgi:hypothetical protein